MNLGALPSLETITIPVADGVVALVSCAMAFREMHIHEITSRNWKSVRFIFIIYDLIIYDLILSTVTGQEKDEGDESQRSKDKRAKNKDSENMPM